MLRLPLTSAQATEGGRSYKLFGRVAQLVRAPALQAGGQRFESVFVHQNEFIMLRTFAECCDEGSFVLLSL